MSTIPASGLPANPLRPFEAETCEEALARLEEATRGSPMVSDEENAEAVRLAEEQVARLCREEGQLERDTRTGDHN